MPAIATATNARPRSARVAFPAMGSAAEVLITGPAASTERARRQIEDLEQKWSRFRPDSEISALNSSGTAEVSPETLILVETCLAAWQLTGGTFDPTVIDALEEAGYDRTFSEMDATSLETVPYRRSPGLEGVAVDHRTSRVSLPPGVRLDPGGIGKGLAADMVAETLVEEGAAGVSVNLGGDVRVVGEPAAGDRWVVRIHDPAVLSEPIASVGLVEGAVATTTTRRRRWVVAGEGRHHLIDPLTGASMTGDATLVSAVAATGWWAEAVTKQLIARPIGEMEGVAAEACALAVDEHGGVHLIDNMEVYLI